MRGRSLLALALLLPVALVAVYLVLSAFLSPRQTQSPPPTGAQTAPTSTRAFAFNPADAPRPLPDLAFVDGDGRPLTLADFRGKVVLLNIWATWCVPCREEMPTLDRLQAELGGPDFAVVALSIDRAGAKAVHEFYEEIGIRHLGLYVDSSGKASRDVGVVGLPTTLLVDREGRELGRLIGPAEWDSPEAVTFIRRHLQQKADLRVRPWLTRKANARLPDRNLPELAFR